jgi:UDP-N-acetylglucosamine 2-epimerase (non-hydrolysing)
MKVAVIVGTRPEIIKLAEVIKLLDEHLELSLIHTGQNYDYELNEIFFEGFGIRRPDVFLEAAGSNCAETVGNVIAKSYDVLKDIAPDAVLIYGDTNSCMCAYSAKRLKIPVFHMEAGNRCFDERVPEEINRRVIDHISDINMTITEHARRYLIQEGVNPETVFKVGSSMPEVIHANYRSTPFEFVNLGIQRDNYLLVSCHREENVDGNVERLVDALNYLSSHYYKPVIVSLHPRTRSFLNSCDKELEDRVRLCKPFSFSKYMDLQTNAYCVISDSGTITEEASYMGFPAVTIRQTNERPEGFDAGVLTMCELSDHNHLIDCIEVSRSCKRNPVTDYLDSQVSQKVLKIIMSYTSYINRTVWRKS